MTAADPRIAALEARTREILERGEAAPDPEAAEREKAVVRECRYLMRLLAIRRRSEGEMRERLERREVPGATIHEAIARMHRADLVDDLEFAREWVRQRRRDRGLADAALRRELEARCVAADLIERALREEEPLSADHGPLGATAGEEHRCRELVRSRLAVEQRRSGEDLLDENGQVREGSESWSAIRRRLDGYLARRGYSGALAVHVISSEMRLLAQG